MDADRGILNTVHGAEGAIGIAWFVRQRIQFLRKQERRMSPDNDALDRKRRSLQRIAQEAAPSLEAEEVDSVVSTFATLSAPEVEEPRIGYITIDSVSRPEATSRKPGNIVLNWRKLIDLVPDTALAGLGAATGSTAVLPWAIPLAGLYIWNKVWRAAEEKLTEVEASIVLALWKNRNPDHKVIEADGFTYTNTLRTNVGQSPLTLGQYTEGVTRLARIECVEIEDGVIWLREWIRVRF
jgi:hypothetical protein